MDNTVFLEAVQQGNMQLVSQMLQQEPALAQAQTENGLSALLLAAWFVSPAMKPCASMVKHCGAMIETLRQFF